MRTFYLFLLSSSFYISAMNNNLSLYLPKEILQQCAYQVITNNDTLENNCAALHLMRRVCKWWYGSLKEEWFIDGCIRLLTDRFGISTLAATYYLGYSESIKDIVVSSDNYRIYALMRKVFRLCCADVTDKQRISGLPPYWFVRKRVDRGMLLELEYPKGYESASGFFETLILITPLLGIRMKRTIVDGGYKVIRSLLVAYMVPSSIKVGRIRIYESCEEACPIISIENEGLEEPTCLVDMTESELESTLHECTVFDYYYRMNRPKEKICLVQ